MKKEVAYVKTYQARIPRDEPSQRQQTMKAAGNVTDHVVQGHNSDENTDKQEPTGSLPVRLLFFRKNMFMPF